MLLFLNFKLFDICKSFTTFSVYWYLAMMKFIVLSYFLFHHCCIHLFVYFCDNDKYLEGVREGCLSGYSTTVYSVRCSYLSSFERIKIKGDMHLYKQSHLDTMRWSAIAKFMRSGGRNGPSLS